jgi:hypothetical protein
MFSLSVRADLVDGEAQEIAAKKLLGQDLLKLGKSVTVKEARYPDSKAGGGKDFNANDGNPFTANTTYHSYVWDYCMQWAGQKNCQKWLDPYVSEHGLEAGGDEKSPLEGLIAGLWNQKKKPGDTGAGGQYGIWNVEKRGGGSVLDEQGKLDRKNLTKFELQKDVRKQVEDIGDEAAKQQASITVDEEASKNTMPNMEGLRLMAGRYTRQMRNRLAANLGELRAFDKGIEFTLGEGAPDCDSYLEVLKRAQEKTKTQDRIEGQAELDPETITAGLQERYNRCVQLRNASVEMVNPQVQNDGAITPGGLNDEQVDKWRSRVNIATIDYAGIDPESIPKPGDVQLTEEEKKSRIGLYDDGGANMKEQLISNAKQIQGYNNELEKASAAMKEAVARTGFIPDASSQITQHKIAVGTTSLVELNGLTKEMKHELKGTRSPASEPTSAPNPDRNLELAPSQVTLSAVK